MYEQALKSFADAIGHTFSDPMLLEQALRHPSYTHERPSAGPHNQRLEFLGDAVLGLVIAEHLIRTYPDTREGELTRFRAALVSERALAEAARDIYLGRVIVLGKGEHGQGGRDRSSVLADTVEAVVGAAFLDGGLEAARAVVSGFLGERLRRIDRDATLDHKSALQERIQSEGRDGPIYEVAAESGPDHGKRFAVEVCLDGEVIGRGAGTSKKLAEQAAAQHALSQLDEAEGEAP